MYAYKVKVRHKNHQKVCKTNSLENIFKVLSDLAYLHLIDTSVQVQKQLNTFDQQESLNKIQVHEKVTDLTAGNSNKISK